MLIKLAWRHLSARDEFLAFAKTAPGQLQTVCSTLLHLTKFESAAYIAADFRYVLAAGSCVNAYLFFMGCCLAVFYCWENICYYKCIMVGLFIEWYFLDIPRAIKKIWGNYLWFFARYFAFGRLLKEFFAPWKGLVFRREKRSYEIGDAFSAALSNMFSGFLGALARSFYLVIGLGVELLTLAAGILAYAIWLVFIPAIFYSLVMSVAVLV